MLYTARISSLNVPKAHHSCRIPAQGTLVRIFDCLKTDLDPIFSLILGIPPWLTLRSQFQRINYALNSS